MISTFRKALAVASSLLMVATLSACSVTAEGAPKDLGGDAAFASYYEQKIDWTRCGDIWCATVEVPINWNDPNSDSMTIALNQHMSPSAKRNLLVNPGGPGASGVAFVRDNYDYIGTKSLRAEYNIIGFDPRGTGDSSPVRCLNAAQTDYLLYGDNGFEIGSKEDLESSRKEIAKFVDACVKNTGPVLGFIDTVSAARDMDVIRVALGQATLDYIGYSYGTFLGTTYAALYPERVGRFVLDGAIDPRVSDADQSFNQLMGFDLAITDFAKWCLKQKDCPFSGTVDDVRSAIAAKFRYVENNQLPTDQGRKLTIAGLQTGVIMGLYSEEYWTYLLQGFTQLNDNDGSLFLRLADFYNDRADDGTYSTNTLEANIAINCLDSRQPADDASMQAQNKRLVKASSVFGRYWQNGALTCENWPYPVAQKPESYVAEGAPTILVIGTTGDPATPYQQSVALAHEVLADAILLTYEGEGHTAYGRSNSCVDRVVDDFLLDGKLPSSDPTC